MRIQLVFKHQNLPNFGLNLNKYDPLDGVGRSS